MRHLKSTLVGCFPPFCTGIGLIKALKKREREIPELSLITERKLPPPKPLLFYVSSLNRGLQGRKEKETRRRRRLSLNAHGVRF